MTHILLVYQKLIPSAVLCGHVQLEYLAGKKKIEYRHSEVYQVTAEMISWADTVILVRGALELDLLIAKTAKTAGKRTVYVLDDDLLNVPEHIESSRFYGSPVTQWLMKRIMGNSDCFASPSDVLLEKYGSLFKETAEIEEPAMNRGGSNPETEETVSILYAGSLDRTKDIEILLGNVIKRLQNEFSDSVSFTFFGAKPSFVDELGLNYIGYQMEYADYMAVMSRCRYDIGLAPMIETEFGSCKHYNKYIEYSSYGIVGVYSNVLPYTRAVRNMENGILCGNTEEEWYESIKKLIKDSQLRKRLGETCRREADTVYSLERVSEDYYKNLELNRRNETTKTVAVFLFRMKRKMYRLVYFFMRCAMAVKRRIRDSRMTSAR